MVDSHVAMLLGMTFLFISHGISKKIKSDPFGAALLAILQN